MRNRWIHRLTFAPALAVLSFIIAVGFAGCGQGEEVALGAVMPLSGAGDMSDVKRGMELALSEVNASGGINGREAVLHVADSSGETTTAGERLRELEAEHEPLVVFSALSSVTRVVSTEAEQARVPLIGLVATDPGITQGTEWTYVFYPSAEHEVEPVFTILREHRVRTVAVWHLDDAYGRSVARETEQRFAGMDITVDALPHDGDAASLAGEAERLVDNDAVYLVGYPKHIVGMKNVLDAAEYSGLVFSTSTVTLPSLRTEHDLDGVFAAAPLIYNDTFIFAREVSSGYEDRFDRSFNHYAATGYAIIRIVAGLLEGEELTRERVKQRLQEGFIYTGVFGEIRLPADDHNIYFPLHPARIEGDSLRYIQ